MKTFHNLASHLKTSTRDAINVVWKVTEKPRKTWLRSVSRLERAKRKEKKKRTSKKKNKTTEGNLENERKKKGKKNVIDALVRTILARIRLRSRLFTGPRWSAPRLLAPRPAVGRAISPIC